MVTTPPSLVDFAEPPRIDFEAIDELPQAIKAIETLAKYTFDLYAFLARTSTFATTVAVFSPVPGVDDDDIVDPAAATVFTAQTTANTALTRANTSLTNDTALDGRLDAVAAVASVAKLVATISNPPTQAEVQANADKIDEVITAVDAIQVAAA